MSEQKTTVKFKIDFSVDCGEVKTKLKTDILWEKNTSSIKNNVVVNYKRLLIVEKQHQEKKKGELNQKEKKNCTIRNTGCNSHNNEFNTIQIVLLTKHKQISKQRDMYDVSVDKPSLNYSLILSEQFFFWDQTRKRNEIVPDCKEQRFDVIHKRLFVF